MSPPRAPAGVVTGAPAYMCTERQQESLAWLLQQIRHGVPLCSLQGLAGTGKTTLLAPLYAALLEADYRPTIATPTHRAAEVLRGKGVTDVDTVHARALTAQFTPAYTAARAWLGEPVEESDEEDVDASSTGCGPLPSLLATQRTLLGDRRTAADLLADAATYGSVAVLESLGVYGRDHIVGFGPKPMQGRGVIIIDEASMVGRELLTLCQQVYRQIILVGDPGQLPPVNDEPILAHVPATFLTEIHRQAAESRLKQLAYRARNHYAFWKWGVQPFSPDAQQVETADAKAFLVAPLLVWRNAVRHACTHAIRAALGYPPDALVPGEPLVCRATAPALRQDGYYCNALFRVAWVNADSRSVALVDDVTQQLRYARVHLEELDGAGIPLGAIPFRFGYALTCHTAQGGEWPMVFLSQPDLSALAGYSWHTHQMETLARWAYTAVTRAKESLRLLATHEFTT
jgi:exodeoxyribonuclease V